MKLNALSLSFGLALLAGTQGPALSADFNYGAGGIREVGYGAQAIPVPAPAPVPVYSPEYYFRADAGLGFGDDPTAAERGLTYGIGTNTGQFGVNQSSINNDFETFVTLGLGVGRYWSEHFRSDLTAETRTQGKVKFNNNYTYTRTAGNGNAIQGEGSSNDETTLHGGVFLANAYYDFNRMARYALRPYIGAGVGFAWNELKRNHSTIENECNVNAGQCPAYLQSDVINVQDKIHTVTFAAAVMTGVTYQLTENTSLDMNYRFLYIDGTDIELGINGARTRGNSQVSIGETYEHQIRAGLRYDIN